MGRVVSCLLMAFALAAPAAAGREESVRVPVAPDLSLAGRLHLPDAPGPVAAVVLFPGSQASRNLPGIATHLAARGIAALELEKRGVGGSDGRWHDETIGRQAGDALAAVRFLQARPEVDGARVGIAGHSQGGWVAQLAAATSDDVAFVILLAGPAQTVREQILADEANHLRGWGVPGPEVDGRIAMFGELLDAAMSNPAVCGPVPRHYLCGLVGYDPAPALARIRVPVLALFGERDPMTPPGENVARLQAALAHLRPDDLSVTVFPEANHSFWPSRTGLRDEYARIPHVYVPGFLETISDWILGTASPPAPSPAGTAR